MKNNGDIVAFVKQKDYVMINNDLGSGSFGKTVLIKDPFIDELFVAKKYEPYYEEDKKEFYDSFLQEIKIMYKLNHPNVVRIFNYYPFESSYTGYIIMEYVDGVNILDFFNDPFKWVNADNPDNIFVQLIDGFDYIEKQGIVHRDIREGNILVTKDGIVKIIDFGLGKTFSPVDLSRDSMVEIINRSGLDCLPNEYFEGKYNTQTDMFYLAELFNRVLRITHMDFLFSYAPILQKMMAPAKENRYQSFSEIKEAIATKDFSTLAITDEDKAIYQNFSDAIETSISCYTQDPLFVTDISEFVERLSSLNRKNCFEDIIHNNSDLINTVVKSTYKFYTNKRFNCAVSVDFERWVCSLSDDSKRLVLNNIISKISSIRIESLDDQLPF